MVEFANLTVEIKKSIKKPKAYMTSSVLVVQEKK